VDQLAAQVIGGLLLLGVSGTGTIVVLLLRRTVNDQDGKLDRLGEKLDVLAEQVGTHAQQLAAGAQRMDDASRRLAALEKQVLDVSVHGCARACARPTMTPVPRGDGG
jgi:hypothetical protein